MFYTLKIPGTLPLSPNCIDSIYKAKYETELRKHGLGLPNIIQFDNPSFVTGLNLRPLFLKDFDKIVGSVISSPKLLFDGIPYYNYFLANDNSFIRTSPSTSISAIEMINNAGDSVEPKLNLIQSGSSELPPYILNFNRLNVFEREQYLNTLSFELREIISNEDFNNPIFMENISSLTIDLKSQLGNNWINSTNYALLRPI